MTGDAIVVRGDALNLPLEDESVDLIITSPPYFALRSYRDSGEHYANQLGSEETPQAFIDVLIEATREMVRVLKPSGSIFVNLGDSYCGSGGYNNSAIGAGGRGPSDYKWRRRGAGRDGNEADWTEATAAWLAGVMDSDGSISIRAKDRSFVPWCRIGQMQSEAVREAARITGVGQVFQDKRGVWNWNVASQQAAYVLQRIWPYLRIKQPQALAAIELARHIQDVGASGKRPVTTTEINYRQQIRDAVLAWNRGEIVDWSAPRTDKLHLPRYSRWRVKTKSLNGLPWRYALRCIDDLGLILRAEIIWSKPNGLPESVTDRVRRNHEQWFHFVRSPRYFAAMDEVRTELAPKTLTHRGGGQAHGNERNPDNNFGSAKARVADMRGALPGSVWSIPSEPLKVPAHLGVDHFAAFPQEWPRRLILGWAPGGICVDCGEGRRPVVDRQYDAQGRTTNGPRSLAQRHESPGREVRRVEQAAITGYACACPEPTAETRPAVVLDNFGGTGTVAMVARALGRYGISVDLSHDYSRLARWRVFESGHAGKTMSRTNLERQGGLL